MIISITNAVLATQIFLGIFILALLVSLRRKKNSEPGLPLNLTQELKGIAILAVVFSHIGYFLVSDQRFLFPLIIAAGVGVNLFLFLSGYGLATSAQSKPLSVGQFYKRRLFKLYLPLWLSLIVFFGLDYFVGHKSYGLIYTLQSFFGYFSRANLYLDVDSPLWYFTFIIFYYLLFPLLFWRKFPWLSALVLYLAGYILIKQNPTFLNQVIGLYRIHILAFPLGVLVSGLIFKYQHGPVADYLAKIWALRLRASKYIRWPLYYIWLLLLLILIAYYSYYSHVGQGRIEELVSLLTGGLIILFFLSQKVESRLLYWFGFYSYEIYLLHWPLMYRFDIFYRYTPAWLATGLYLALFLGLSWLLRLIIKRLRL